MPKQALAVAVVMAALAGCAPVEHPMLLCVPGTIRDGVGQTRPAAVCVPYRGGAVEQLGQPAGEQEGAAK